MNNSDNVHDDKHLLTKKINSHTVCLFHMRGL